MDKDLPKTLYDQMDKEHREIEDHITHLEEISRQHFENEAKLLELQSQSQSQIQSQIQSQATDDLNMDYLLETYKKSHQELLEAIESIADEFRDHIRLEEWYQGHTT